MRPSVLFLVAATACVTAGCRQATPDAASGQTAATGSTHHNVLLVTIDTLRADHVGCYGNAAAATPTLDALAARGVRFETAVAHVPLTGPSHASILTGHTPPVHGFRNNGGFVLAPSLKTAAEDFRQAGYRTGGFVSGFPLGRRFGFDRGFETYEDHFPRGNDPRRTPYVERRADATTDVALRWLSSRTSGARASPWFLWVHYYDPHAPYEPPADLAARFTASPYDGEIAFADQQLGRLLKSIQDSGAIDDTVVLVTSDHGESLGEHGEATHGVFIYDATLKVPLIMAGPGVAAGRVAHTVARSIDVLPTLLDYAGVRPPDRVEGRSMRPAADGREMADAPSYAESLYTQLELGWAPLYAWRTAQYKFIDAPKPELYDLQHDGAERNNQFAQEAQRADEFRRRLQALVRQAAPTDATAAPADSQTVERLRSLGYLSGGQPSQPVDRVLRDPKDLIRFLPRLNRAMSATRIQPDLAIREMTSVIAEDPTLVMARRTRAAAYEASGRYELAIADLRDVERSGQLSADDAVMLGDNLRLSGQHAEAARVLDRAIAQNPRSPQPLLSRAEVQIAEQQYDQAAVTLDRVLKIAPDEIEALRRLGDLALLKGDVDGAGGRYARILELDPHDVPAMTKLGVVRMREGRKDEATRLFNDAVALDPTNADALLYLAGALASGGRQREALPVFERAIAADPKSTMALNGLGLTRLALGDKTGASAALRTSLRLDPSQSEIARTLAEIRQ
jgi:arylsulfatase A-like enzyme/Flp pilus assembly protein TadD